MECLYERTTFFEGDLTLFSNWTSNSDNVGGIVKI